MSMPFAAAFFIFSIFFQSTHLPVLPAHDYQINLPVQATSSLNKEDAIIGKWITVEKNVEVEVYKDNNIFHARVVWFKIEDTTRPMNTRMDEKNPDPKLRTRKWLGLEVLRGLKYNSQDDEWKDGIIYDAKHGKQWDSVVWINSKGLMKVKGYWVFQFISEILTFQKVSG
jgi:uncharacterized protein (DUF2147 family)